MKNRINILNCPIDNMTMEETIDIIDKSIQNKINLHHSVVNVAKLIYMQKDKELYYSIINSNIINADGQAVVWASRFLGKDLPERVTGIDLMQNLVKLAYKKKYKIFFFGAKEEIVKSVVDKYSKIYSYEIIAGYRNGYFKKNEEENIAKEIANSKADILFVAISSPKKEIFLNRYRNIINISFIMGVGGSFDVIAGKVKRAPLWMQKYGLEWFYRFLQEPRRMWKRYLVTNSLFIYLILKNKFKNK
ncbi:MAG: WecB/TagA/CpsF family glycosyltransferase [Sulfurovaceae bacterium]|nr:WecB/TagA/CpsF family glycosyltransferase [Sulfurovaceae bacterium]